MPKILLTDRFATHAKAQVGEPQTDYRDETVEGLLLRVAVSGKKTWNFLAALPGGGRPRILLGSYPATSLATARGLALEARACVDRGEDPRTLFSRRSSGAMTVAGLVERYLDMHVRPLRSGYEIERRLRRNVLPVIGDVKITELHRRDINRVVDPIIRRGARTEAQRVYADLSALTRWALARGELERDPMLGLRKPPSNPPRDRVLSDAEIKTLWDQLPTVLARSKQCQQIIKLALLTAQRVGEITGMRLDELDLDRKTWTLPGERTKNKFSHVVPLSEPVIEIIREALTAAGKGAESVFPSNGGSLPSAAVARTIIRTRTRFGLAPWSAHDLRRTALTGMSRLGIAPLTLAHVANHRTGTQAGVTLSVYVHDDHTKQKAVALELWAERLVAGIVGGGAEVIPLRGAR